MQEQKSLRDWVATGLPLPFTAYNTKFRRHAQVLCVNPLGDIRIQYDGDVNAIDVGGKTPWWTVNTSDSMAMTFKNGAQVEFSKFPNVSEGWVGIDAAPSSEARNCSCDIVALMRTGCACGGT